MNEDMNQVQFDQLKQQFAKTDDRFVRMDSLFSEIRAEMSTRFDKVDRELSDVKGTVRRTAIEVCKIKADVFDMKCDVATKDDLTRLRSHLETRMDSYAAEIEADREERLPKE